MGWVDSIRLCGFLFLSCWIDRSLSSTVVPLSFSVTLYQTLLNCVLVCQFIRFMHQLFCIETLWISQWTDCLYVQMFCRENIESVSSHGWLLPNQWISQSSDFIGSASGLLPCPLFSVSGSPCAGPSEYLEHHHPINEYLRRGNWTSELGF